MPDVNTTSDIPDKPGKSVAGFLFCEAVTRRNRPPCPHDQIYRYVDPLHLVCAPLEGNEHGLKPVLRLAA